jgi:hypothetical protein
LDDETAAAIEQINFRLDHIEKHLVNISKAGPSIRYAPVGPQRLPFEQRVEHP